MNLIFLPKHMHANWLDVREKHTKKYESSLLPITTRSNKHRQHPFEFVGSGFLLEISELQYIVTAKHVIDDTIKTGFSLLDSNNQLITLNLQNEFEVIECGKENDLAMIDVTDSDMFEGKPFIPYRIPNSPLSELDLLYFAGFPASKNKKISFNHTLTPAGIMTQKKCIEDVDEKFIRDRNIDVSKTIFMRYEPHHVTDDYKKIDNLISPSGLSGSPIFSIGSFENMNLGKLNELELIGVFTNRKDNLAWGVLLDSFVEPLRRHSYNLTDSPIILPKIKKNIPYDH